MTTARRTSSLEKCRELNISLFYVTNTCGKNTGFEIRNFYVRGRSSLPEVVYKFSGKFAPKVRLSPSNKVGFICFRLFALGFI